MSWGTKISIVIVTFLAGLIGMVILANKQNNYMIDQNYYEKELVFQDKIEAAKNFNALQIKRFANRQGASVQLQFDSTTYNTNTRVTIEILCNANTAYDRFFNNLKPNKNSLCFTLPNSKLQYTMRIRWTHNGKKYYNQQLI